MTIIIKLSLAYLPCPVCESLTQPIHVPTFNAWGSIPFVGPHHSHVPSVCFIAWVQFPAWMTFLH